MVIKSLYNRLHFEEITLRISKLTENSPRKWEKMNAAQMLKHCDLILQIALNKVDLPKINALLEMIGICTKIEIQVFNNVIPRNMLIFKKLIVNFECALIKQRKAF